MPRPHIESNIGNPIHKGKCLFACRSVDPLRDFPVGIVPRIEPTRPCGIRQARGVICSINFFEHVVQRFQESNYRSTTTSFGISRETFQSTSIIEEGHLGESSFPPHEKTHQTGQEHVHIRRPFPKLVFVPVQHDAAAADCRNGSPQAPSLVFFSQEVQCSGTKI